MIVWLHRTTLRGETLNTPRALELTDDFERRDQALKLDRENHPLLASPLPRLRFGADFSAMPSVKFGAEVFRVLREAGAWGECEYTYVERFILWKLGFARQLA